MSRVKCNSGELGRAMHSKLFVGILGRLRDQVASEPNST